MPPLPPKRPSSPFASMGGPHVALRVPDFEAGKRWFVEKLDFRVVHEWPLGDLGVAYIAPPNDDTFWVEIIGGGAPETKPPFSDLLESLHLGGYHHICLTVDSVDATVAELRRRGVAILAGPFDRESISRRLAFFADPWGNLIELAQVLP